MKKFVHIFLSLLALGSVLLLIKFGYDFKDITYYLLATIIFFISVGSFVKRERLPQISIPKIDTKFIFHRFIAKFSKLRLGASNKNRHNQKGVKKSWIIRIVGLAISTLTFSYLVVYQFKSSPQDKNFVFSYLDSLYNYFWDNLTIIILLAIVLVSFNLLVRVRNKQRESFFRITIHSLLESFVEILVGLPTALIAIFLFVVIFYNSLIAISIFNAGGLNIHTDKNDIKQIIDKGDSSFELVGLIDTPSKTFIVNAPYFGVKSEYFTTKFVPSLPDFLFIKSPTINRSVYLIGNKLVIKELDKDIFQTFAPTLVKKLLKKDLSPRFIKDEPNVDIISRQDYLKYREDEINKQIDEITGYINDAKKLLSSFAYNIQTAKNSIATYQSYISLNTQYRDDEYNKCVNATWTYYGYYTNYTYRLYTDAYCQSQKAGRDQKNAEYQNEILTSQRNLSYYQSQYNEFKEYLDQFQNYKVFIEATKDQTPYELGVFEPDKSVKVVLDSVGEKDITNFLETLTHEYIHYTSYVSEERSLPQFFEEGLTEYIARKVVSNQLHKDVNLGYPLIVKIISIIAQKIPINQLEDIYFNKSADQLEYLLDQAYGKDFYKDTQLYFALIPYSPDEEALKFANNIMYKIGGPDLQEKDLYSN